MSDEQFKTVTDPGGVTAYKNRGGQKEPDGLTRAEADADAAKRNARAAELGIATRYVVAPLEA